MSYLRHTHAYGYLVSSALHFPAALVVPTALPFLAHVHAAPLLARAAAAEARAAVVVGGHAPSKPYRRQF